MVGEGVAGGGCYYDETTAGLWDAVMAGLQDAKGDLIADGEETTEG